MIHKHVFTSLLWVCLIAASALVPRDLCSTVSFTLPVVALNGLFSAAPDPNNETQVEDFVSAVFSGSVVLPTGTQSVSETFTINGVYCKPLLVKHNALQLLVHGITYDKTYWSGLGFGNLYNYQDFAGLNGYATLAIDRLGHGANSQRPDPFTVVQAPVHIEIFHQLIYTIRSTSGNPLGRRFSKIAYIGHSYGSFLGAGLARQYPTDIDALVLTGYSTTLNVTTISNVHFVSASVLFPELFKEPLGYVTVSQPSQREAAFYAGGYNRSIPPVDYHFEDTVTDGEAAGLVSLFQPSPAFSNPLLIITGVNDALLCRPPLSSCLSLLAASGQLFPNTTHFEYSAIPNTGHDLNLHYSAPVTFARIHLFLDKYF